MLNPSLAAFREPVSAFLDLIKQVNLASVVQAINQRSEGCIDEMLDCTLLWQQLEVKEAGYHLGLQILVFLLNTVYQIGNKGVRGIGQEVVLFSERGQVLFPMIEVGIQRVKLIFKLLFDAVLVDPLRIFTFPIFDDLTPVERILGEHLANFCDEREDMREKSDLSFNHLLLLRVSLLRMNKKNGAAAVLCDLVLTIFHRRILWGQQRRFNDLINCGPNDEIESLSLPNPEDCPVVETVLNRLDSVLGLVHIPRDDFVDGRKICETV